MAESSKKDVCGGSAVLESIQNKVFNQFKDRLSDGHVYHNYQHTKDTVDACREMGEHYKLSKEKLTLLQLAAWCHDIGFVERYDGHEEVSCEIAAKWLQEEGMNEECIEAVQSLIKVTKKDGTPQNLLEEILCDADIIHIGKKKFFHKGELLRIEKERVLDYQVTDQEWQQSQLNFLVGTNFNTEYATLEYGPRKEKNLKKQREILKKSIRRQTKKKVDKIKSRKLGRGIETMYRSTYRNHINLSSIADAKANMMISLNTIIMSVIITVVGSGYAFSSGALQSIRFTVPMTILLFSSLVAVIFAVVSAKPDVTEKSVDIEKIKKKKSSVLFFGNFSKLELKDFVYSLRELKADRDLLYDNMSVDIYYLGVVLTRKYRLVRYSYLVFIVGLTLSVLSFLTILLYSSE